MTVLQLHTGSSCLRPPCLVNWGTGHRKIACLANCGMVVVLCMHVYAQKFEHQPFDLLTWSRAIMNELHAEQAHNSTIYVLYCRAAQAHLVGSKKVP